MVTPSANPRRILPLSEWHSAHEAIYNDGPATSSSSASAYSNDTGADGVEKDVLEHVRPTTANPFRRTRSISSTIQWRRRPKSLILASESFETPGEAGENALQENNYEVPTEETRLDSSIKGKIRRASITFMKGIAHRRDRRSSEPGDSHDDSDHLVRPSTAHSTWHKLRQAASFRHSKVLNSSRAQGLETIYSPLQSSFPDVTVPGNGLEPPIIPSHTGAAAKASAALQNEYLAFVRQREEWLAEQVYNDGESGIGIAVSTAGDAESSTASAMDNGSITRVDFISRLPSEIAVQVLSHLDATHLGAAGRVSKAWNAIAQDQHIWRESFLREKTNTFATSLPVQPGVGGGVPPIRPGNDWQNIYKARQELDKKWKEGTSAKPVYLNGHLDSIYCLQFDEYVSKLLLSSQYRLLTGIQI